MKATSKTVLITGTSSGIGLGIARELILRGYRIFGSVRREEDANRVRSELGEGFVPLLFDVTDQAAIDRAAVEVRRALNGEGLGGLINNSGIVVSGPIELLPVEELVRGFDVNVFGLLRVTKAFLPLLGAQKDHPSAPGRILNIGSVAGHVSVPYLAAYNGSKHALEGISQTMRRELMRYGIRVVIVGPGPVETPIFGKSSLESYAGTTYYDSLTKFFTKIRENGKKNGMPMEECSRRIADIFETERPKTRYAVVRGKFMNWTLLRLLPDRALDSFFEKMM